jgi:hypothetical protein
MRLLIYDGTCSSLSRAWYAGSVLYRGLSRLDACKPVRSWQEALEWLARHERIDEIQYWGHGRWGRVFVADDVLDARVFSPSHPLHASMRAVKERLAPDALVWFRTCEAFGARPGLDFAERFANELGVQVAGHTFIIGLLQSGLRTLAPGCRPTWDPAEGIAEGTPEEPKRALHSLPGRPRTISCFSNEVPRAWLSEDALPSGDGETVV